VTIWVNISNIKIYLRIDVSTFFCHIYMWLFSKQFPEDRHTGVYLIIIYIKKKNVVEDKNDDYCYNYIILYQ